MRLNYTPAPIAEEFILSNQLGLSAVDAIWGPWGSGKSVACVIKILKQCIQMPVGSDGYRRSRWAVVRNTRPQLKSTTMKTWDDWITKFNLGYWRYTDSTFFLHFNDVRAEIMFKALDDKDDERNVLSLELTGAWFNEAREIEQTIFTAVKGRTGRYPSAAMFDDPWPRNKDNQSYPPYWYGVIADSNFPDEDSFYCRTFEPDSPEGWRLWKQPGGLIEVITDTNKYITDRTEEVPASVQTHFVVNPEAENIENLPADYYTQHINVASKPWIRINLCARYGASLDGKPVYAQTFSRAWHVSKTSLKAIPYLPLVIGMDFGRTPAAAIKQVQENGRICTLAEVYSDNMGLETFLDTKLTPFLKAHFPGIPVLVAPDPSGVSRSQYAEVNAFMILESRGYKYEIPETNAINTRINTVEAQLSRTLAGQPLYIIDPSCKRLITGFEKGYRYKERKDGTFEDVPDKKSIYSHIHDANQYGDMVCRSSGLSGALLGTHMAQEIKVASAAGWT